MATRSTRSCLVASLLVLFIVGGLDAQPNSDQPVGKKECGEEFEVEGSFRGKTFRTTQTLGEVTIEDALKRMGRGIAKRGYEGVDVDTDLWTITAHQSVSFGKGKTVPLNVVVEENDAGEAIAEIVVQLSGGLSRDKDGTREEFCEILEEGMIPSSSSP